MAPEDSEDEYRGRSKVPEDARAAIEEDNEPRVEITARWVGETGPWSSSSGSCPEGDRGLDSSAGTRILADALSGTSVE